MFDAPMLHELSRPLDDGPHVLLVVADQRARYTLADVLLTAGCRLTLCSSYGVADLLLQQRVPFDLLVVAQALDELGRIARIARAVDPDVPILMLEGDTAAGPGLLAAVQTTMQRWPIAA